MTVVFEDYPHLKLLQNLAKGSLDQIQNFSRAIRLYVLLRWLYSDRGHVILGDSFTYTAWRQVFFSKTHKDEKQEDIINHQDLNCACIKTTRQWCSELEIPVGEWQDYLVKEMPVLDCYLEKLLEERLFAQVRKSLQSDFDVLVSKSWLQQLTDTTGRSKQYRRVQTFPIFNELNNFASKSNLSTKLQTYVAGTLGMFGFLDPSLPLLAEQISDPVNEENYLDEENHRVFLYVDYVVPESSPTQDAVDQLQSELQEIWDSGNIPPLLLTYHSAHQNKIKECVVYPVCIYFMERAKYLCAYGSTPLGEINWYKYRLDRIISKRLVFLDWLDPRVPQLLKEMYDDDELPTPTIVNTMLKSAWGFDFYKEEALMIMRFDRDFHDSYIQGISIHDTFTPINKQKAEQLVIQYTQDPEQRRVLVGILHSRPATDAYYCVRYRISDYYILRRLRALGSRVEVILPWQLRQEMAAEINTTRNLYM